MSEEEMGGKTDRGERETSFACNVFHTWQSLLQMNTMVE